MKIANHHRALLAHTADRSHPLSYAQESLWLLDKMSRQSGVAYNESLAFRIHGDLHVDHLRRALLAVVERHEALRTVFVETGGVLRAVVQDRVEGFINIVDLRSATEDASRRAEELIVDTYRKPFDLTVGPLLRAIIIRVAEDEYVFGLTIHHIATDGWSMGIIFEEIRDHYASLRRLGRCAEMPPLKIHYKDYALATREAFEQGAFQDKIEYWAKLLSDAPERLELPLDYSRPPRQTFNGSTYTTKVAKAKIEAFIERCRQECGSTEFVVLLSAYAVLLKRYTGKDAITIGTTVLNRTDVQALGVVGCFVNTTALVLHLDDNMTFRQLLARAAELTQEMLDRQDAPYAKVLARLDVQRDPSYNPVFQTMLTLLGKKQGLDLGEEVTCQPLPFKRVGAKFELLVSISADDDDVEVEAEFNTDLFHVETIKRMMAHYEHLIERLTVDLDATVSQLPLLLDDERTLILDSWNSTRADYPETTVIDMIEAQAQATPDAVAVEFRDQLLTYAALNRVADQVARYLMTRRAEQAESSPFIGVYMERSIEMVVALVAIVKAGYAYVPIDPEYPKDRIRFMIDDADLSLILTQDKHEAALQDVDAEIVALSNLDRRCEDDGAVVRSLSPDSNVYMIYTSGSTGKPKGVINRHDALFNRLYWMQSEYGLTASDRILQKTPFSFDVSVWEFFWPLMFGARIVVAEPGGHRDADYLKRVIVDKEITTLHFVPSMLNAFLDEEGVEECRASLRRVFCSGEALTYKTVEKFVERLPCELHNLYGPTEAAIDVSYWPCSLDYPGKIVPIGKPIANIKLYVLDKYMQLQPVGVPGELWIGGVGLAKGYHKRDELTRTCFLENPFDRGPGARIYKTGDLARYLHDGNIEYLGRIDNQVKLRGFRIELGEIEATIKTLPCVKDAVVVVAEMKSNKALVAYVVAEGELDQVRTKSALREHLPEFMVPQIFVTLDAMPISANGKLDRKALPDPFTTALPEAVDDILSTEEEIVIKVWQSVLGFDRIAADSHFFRLGGDSISSIRVAAQLREHGYAVEVHDIFAHPTVRQLALHMRTRHTAASSSVATPFWLLAETDRLALPPNVEDAWPLTKLQSGMIYHTMTQESSPVYHDIFSFELDSAVDAECLMEAFRIIVSNHPQLRSSFDLANFTQPLQLVHADIVVPLELTDISQFSTAEQESIVEQWIEREKRQSFDLQRAPILRVQIHIRAEKAMTLSIAFHHLILDGWSFALVLDEFRSIYTQLLERHPVVLAPERVSYATYVDLERRALRDDAHAAYWLGKTAGLSPSRLPRLNQDGAPRPPQHRSVETIVPGHLVAALQRLATDLDVPLKSVFLAIHLRVLGQLVDRDHVVSGLVTNGRPEVQGGEAMVGLFLNTIPFAVELRRESWRTLIKRVFELEQEVMPHRRFPIAEIQKRSHNERLFDTIFNFVDFHVYKSGQQDSAVKIVKAKYFEQTSYEAVVHVHRDHFTHEMQLIFSYDAAQLEGSLIKRYLQLYLAAAIESSADVGVASLAKSAGVAARTVLEEQIAEIISQAISIPSIGIDDNYLDLGVDSITAIRIVAKIKKLGVELNIQDVFTHQTIRKLAGQLDTKSQSQATPAGLVKPFALIGCAERTFAPPVVDAYPATAMQLDMIRHSSADIEQAAYHDVFSYRLALPVDYTLLRNCLQRAINRHETLRTAFAFDDGAAPLQLVFADVPVHLECFDLSGLDDGQQDSVLDEWFEGEKRNGFDWSKPSLIRFYVHERGERDFHLTLSFHHSIIDGWSLSLFMKELLEDYAGVLAGTAAPVRIGPEMKYRDYVKVELESQNATALQAFWRERLQSHRYNTLPRRPHSSETSRWRETKLVVDAAKQRAVTKLSNESSIPVKHTMLACHARVMSLICAEADVLTGVFTSGRLEEEGGDRMVGLFLNFMPFRQWVGGQTWRELIGQTFQNDRECMPYRRYPLTRICEDLQQEHLFETVFNYTQFSAYGDIAYSAKQEERHRVLQYVRWFEHSHFALLTNVGYDVHQERLIITLNARGQDLSQHQVETIAQIYDAVLDDMVRNPDNAVTEAHDRTTQLVSILRGRRELTLRTGAR